MTIPDLEPDPMLSKLTEEDIEILARYNAEVALRSRPTQKRRLADSGHTARALVEALMATFTCPINTTIGAHSEPARLLQYALILGLDARLHTVGGWFNKSHVLTAKGDSDAVLKLSAAVDRLRARYEEAGAMG